MGAQSRLLIAHTPWPHHHASRLDLPVLIVHGSEDPVISAAAAHTSAATIGGAQLLLLEGRGHELRDADLSLAARRE
jgi:alpha-beta hydrolase superfamily lysophospholipase